MDIPKKAAGIIPDGIETSKHGQTCGRWQEINGKWVAIYRTKDEQKKLPENDRTGNSSTGVAHGDSRFSSNRNS